MKIHSVSSMSRPRKYLTSGNSDDIPLGAICAACIVLYGFAFLSKSEGTYLTFIESSIFSPSSGMEKVNSGFPAAR